MRYALLLYQDESIWVNASEAEKAVFLSQHQRFDEMATERSVEVIHSEPLGVVAGATTVRPSSSGISITDGPFAETAEQLVGFYVIEAPDLDEAIAVSAALPYSVEIRPAGFAD